jgi:hypothetical protein
MKSLRITLLVLAALLMGAGAFAQTQLLPYITGTDTANQNQIDLVRMQRVTRVDGLVATASGTLANSTVLNAGMNIVATVTTTNDSFTLPTLTGSVQISIVNGGANTLKVWPSTSTGQIDTAGAGVGKTVAANKMMTATQGADGLWYSTTSP